MQLVRTYQAHSCEQTPCICSRSAGTSSANWCQTGFDGEDEAAYKVAREFVVNEKTEEYVTRPPDKSVSWAVQKLSANGCTYLESVEAQKVLDNDKWPGLPLDEPKFVKAEVIKKRSNGLKAHTFGWLCANPKIAKIIDLKSWKSQLEQPFIVLPACSERRQR